VEAGSALAWDGVHGRWREPGKKCPRSLSHLGHFFEGWEKEAPGRVVVGRKGRFGGEKRGLGALLGGGEWW